VRETCVEAAEFTQAAGSSGVGAEALAHVELAVADLDLSHRAGPRVDGHSPIEQFALALRRRRRVQQMIRGPRTLKEARELFAYAGWLSETLAWLAHDLGDGLAARAWALDSFAHADQAGHDELCGWAADAMASIALYAGQPERAVKAACDGARRAPAGHPVSVRLRAQAARALARVGARAERERMLAEASTVHDALPARRRAGRPTRAPWRTTP
jgi:hypothetical protein